jgi:hypothetical protein
MHEFFLGRAPHLVLSSTTLRELKRNTTTSQLSVHFRVSIESVVNASLLLLIEDNFQDLTAIFLRAETLADNLNGVNKICEDGVVNGSQRPGTGSLLCEGSSGAVGSLWAGKNTASGEDQDMTVRELLLELTGETILDQQNPQWVEREREMDEKTYRCCTRWKP